MKVLFTFLMVFSLLALTSELYAQKLIGFKAGVTSNILFLESTRPDIFDPEIDQVGKLGVTFGVMYQSFLRHHVGVQIEFNFVQKGWTEKVDDNNKFKTTLNYLELPLLTHIYIGRGKNKFFFLAGPNIGYLISSSESSFNPAIEDQITYRMTSANEKKFSYGVIGGGGISRTTGIGRFQAHFNYNFGLSQIFEKQQDSDPDYSQNQTVSLTIAYLWEIRPLPEPKSK